MFYLVSLLHLKILQFYGLELTTFYLFAQHLWLPDNLTVMTKSFTAVFHLTR